MGLPMFDSIKKKLFGEKESPSKPIVRIHVSYSGNISIDGNDVPPHQLAPKLAQHKKDGGIVWYSRDNPHGDPSVAQFSVFEQVTAARLPIRLIEEASEPTKPFGSEPLQ